MDDAISETQNWPLWLAGWTLYYIGLGQWELMSWSPAIAQSPAYHVYSVPVLTALSSSVVANVRSLIISTNLIILFASSFDASLVLQIF